MTIRVSLTIENSYERYPDATTYVIDRAIPAPPDGADHDDFDQWAYDHIYSCTGVGHQDGDSLYDVTVTASSDPALVGRTFSWGY